MDLLPIEGITVEENKKILLDLLNVWGFAYYYRGDMGGNYRILDECKDQVLEFENMASVSMFLAWYGYTAWGCERYEKAETVLSQALQIAEENNEQKIVAYIHTWLTWHYITVGRYDEAMTSGNRALEIAPLYKNDHYLQFKPFCAIAYLHYCKGERMKLLSTSKKIVEMGEANGIFPAKIFGTVLIAISYVLDGNFTKAVEWSEKVDSDGKEIIHDNCALFVKGIAYLLNGDIEKAKNPLETMVSYCTERWPYLSISGEMMLAVIEVASGRMKDGMKTLLEIRDKFQKNKRGFDWALSEYLLGSIYCQIALGEGDGSFSTMMKNIGFILKNVPFAAKKAENHFNEAISLADKFEAKGIKGQALLDIGRLYAGKKRINEAKDCLMNAIEVFELCEIETFKKRAQDALASLE
jgi:tetratricopeptide (TPR) repeat protein